MELSNEELEWALEIKDAIELDPQLNDLTDYQYAQLAIVCQDNVNDAHQRAVALQSFREEYNVRDTLGDARLRLHNIVQRDLPEIFLAFGLANSNSHNGNDGEGEEGNGNSSYYVAYDMTKFDTSAFTTHDKVCNWYAASYYLLQSTTPNFQAIRGDGVIGQKYY